MRKVVFGFTLISALLFCANSAQAQLWEKAHVGRFNRVEAGVEVRPIVDVGFNYKKNPVNPGPYVKVTFGNDRAVMSVDASFHSETKNLRSAADGPGRSFRTETRGDIILGRRVGLGGGLLTAVNSNALRTTYPYIDGRAFFALDRQSLLELYGNYSPKSFGSQYGTKFARGGADYTHKKGRYGFSAGAFFGRAWTTATAEAQTFIVGGRVTFSIFQNK